MMEQYKELLIETIKTYPKYRHKFIYNHLKKVLDFSEDTNNLFQGFDEFVQVNKYDCNLNKIICAIEQSKIGLIEILKTEFFHSYKYATILEVKEGQDSIKSFFTTNNKYVNSNNKIDEVTEYIDNSYTPSYLELEKGVHALKFSKKLTGYLPIPNDNKTVHKYNVLLIYFENENIIEIRWDSIQTHYNKVYPGLYEKIKNKIISWIEGKCDIKCIPVNLSKTVNFIKNSDNESIIVAAQEMRTKSGSFMTLDIGINEEAILPLLGDLKEIIRIENNLFEANEETKKIKKILEDLIEDKEKTSDLPWITLLWDFDRNVRTKAMQIKFSFNHNNGIFDILMYHGDKPEARRMNDVTRLLIKNKRKIHASRML